MGEKFFAKPEEIAGLGNYVSGGYGSFGQARDLLGKAVAERGFEGLLSSVSGPVNELAASTNQRWDTIDANLATMSTGLRKSAWLFERVDQQNAEALRRHSRSVARGPGETGPLIEVDPTDSGKKIVVDEYPGAVSFGAPTPVDVKEPPYREADVRDLIRDRIGWLADADAEVAKYTGWSPIKQALEPLIGNWEELRRIGEIYGKSGTALGTIGADVQRGSDRLNPLWNGKSAVAFEQYARNTSNYMEWEAALGRMLKEGLGKAATQFEQSVRQVVDSMVEMFGQFIDLGEKKGIVKVLAKAIPGANVVAWADTLINALKVIRDDVMPAVQTIEAAVNDLKAFIEFAQDPVGYVKQKGQAAIDAQLKPYEDQAKDIKRKAQIADDLGTIGSVFKLTDRESGSYRPSTGPDAWDGVP